MSRATKFWGLYVIAACVVIGAAFAYTAHLAEEKEADHAETVEILMWEVNEARGEVEEGVRQAEILAKKAKETEGRAVLDGFIIRSVLIAAMASAENNIADAEAGSLLDCIDATCRVATVTRGSGRSMGTGVVFEIKGGKVNVITNAHVATTPTMHLEFWKNGYKSKKITGTVTLRDRLRDVAVISVDISAFNGWLPGIVPLAARDTVLKDGQEIMSAGCPRGEWAKAWVGHVVKGGIAVIKFKPIPVGGQSGSAIFNAEGTHIVALLNQHDGTLGRAVNIRTIYDAIYGKSTVKETQWRRAPQKQCPNGVCPSQGSESKPEPGQGIGNLRPIVPFVLPVPEPVVEASPLLMPFEDYDLEAVWVDGDGSESSVVVDLLDAPEVEVSPFEVPPLPEDYVLEGELEADPVADEPADPAGFPYVYAAWILVFLAVLIVIVHFASKPRRLK